MLIILDLVFEDEKLAEQAVIAVEKEIHHDVDHDGYHKGMAAHTEDTGDDLGFKM